MRTEVIARCGDAARSAAVAAEQSCGSCRYFCQAPHEIESQMPGIRSLGSAWASVRGSDGICRKHDRYLGATSHCDDYEHQGAEPLDSGHPSGSY
jgi:hypothetical protein